MSNPAVKKPAVPSPAKLRASSDSFLPVRSESEPEPKPEKPIRTKLMEVVSEEDLKAPDNLTRSTDESKYKDMNFKVSDLYHRRVKSVATNWGMSMKELFEAAFENWVEANGESPRSVSDFKRAKEARKARARSSED